MKIGKFRVRRKALSPVIATLLMVAIAVAAAIITYVWSMGLLGGLMTSGGEQTKEQVILENYNWAGASFKITVRNVGSGPLTVDAVYVNGTSATIDGTTDLDPREKQELTLSAYGSGYVTGSSYLVKIVTKTGAVFSFSCIHGRAG